MKQFQQIMWVALLAGAAAGLVLFALQHLTLQPIIHEAEAYEAQAAAIHEPQTSHGETSAGHEWEPAAGWQRSLLTALATVLTGIGFGALLFGVASFWAESLTTWKGLWWGLGGMASFVLAPALGLPPEPPGVAGADLQARQMWWLAAVLATAGGLLLIGWKRHWLAWLSGVLIVALPHLVGAPHGGGPQLVPDDLILRFRIASLASNAVFWLLLGSVGGYLTSRRRNL